MCTKSEENIHISPWFLYYNVYDLSSACKILYNNINHRLFLGTPHMYVILPSFDERF